MNAAAVKNLFKGISSSSSQEEFLTLVEARNLRIERIVSNGQASPEGFWYDQEQAEWVLLLKGTASLKFASGDILELTAGDYLLIESHLRHRVEKVSADAVWLAVHYQT